MPIVAFGSFVVYYCGRRIEKPPKEGAIYSPSVRAGVLSDICNKIHTLHSFCFYAT